MAISVPTYKGLTIPLAMLKTRENILSIVTPFVSLLGANPLGLPPAYVTQFAMSVKNPKCSESVPIIACITSLFLLSSTVLTKL